MKVSKVVLSLNIFVTFLISSSLAHAGSLKLPSAQELKRKTWQVEVSGMPVVFSSEDDTCRKKQGEVLDKIINDFQSRGVLEKIGVKRVKLTVQKEWGFKDADMGFADDNKTFYFKVYANYPKQNLAKKAWRHREGYGNYEETYYEWTPAKEATCAIYTEQEVKEYLTRMGDIADNKGRAAPAVVNEAPSAVQISVGSPQNR